MKLFKKQRGFLTFLGLLPVLGMVGTLLISNKTWSSPYGFDANTFSAYLEGSYFLTKQDYGSGGTTFSLPNNSQFSVTRFDLSTSYDFTDFFEMYSDLGFESSQSILNDPFLGTIQKTNTNISDVSVGTNFLLVSGVVNLIPDLSVSFPLYPTPAGIDNNVLLGDGAIVATAKLYVTKRIRSIFLSGYGGVSYRTQGLSTLIPYGIMGHGDIRKFFVELAATGDFSINNDQDLYNPAARTAVTATLDANSLLFDAVDPSWFNGSATFGWRFAPGFFATAGIQQTIWGSNTASGTKFLVGLGFSGSALPSGSNDSFEVDTQSEDKTVPGDEGRHNGAGKVIGPTH